MSIINMIANFIQFPKSNFSLFKYKIEIEYKKANTEKITFTEDNCG